MRHAKSSWADQGLSDHQRPLNKRGKRDAPRMGQYLADQELVPDRVLSSTAVRARQTAELLIDHCSGLERDQLDTVDELYHGYPDDYFSQLRTLTDDLQTVMMVGHNPGLEELVLRLSDSYERMPTAAIACFETDVKSWGDIDNGFHHGGNIPDLFRLIDVWRPKEI